ncbi:MAG: histidine kinase [Ignavibacteria bacterium]|nr:histidine kinase [Ignavibacteria bacterium]
MTVSFLVILLQSKDELSEYIDLVQSIYNPIYISLVVFLIILILIYISYKHIYNPLLKKHKKEQEQFETNTAKLLALFSELDPNPIIRIDTEGRIVNLNKTAQRIFNEIMINKSKIDSILDSIDFDIKDAIQSGKQFIISKKVRDRFYEINFHGISFLEMAQLYFWDTTLKMEYDEQMSNYQQLLKNTSASLQKTQEEERARISQELHDSVGQNLLLVKLNISNYKKFIPLGIDESEYQRTIEILNSTITKVREVAHNLKPPNLDELGLVILIKSMCRNVSKETGLKYLLHLPENTNGLSKDLQVCIYRIVQESLNNIIRYSKAKEFTVSLLEEPETATIFISDDGIGFKSRKLLNDKYVSDGLGIMNMQESVERLNGNFQIDSSLNQGTNIIATYPIKNKKDETKPEYKNISS